MTIQQIISETKKMKKQEFQDLFFRMLKIANTKYNINVFVHTAEPKEYNIPENKTDNVEEEIHPGIKNLLKYKGILKDIDLSDISEEDIYLQED